MDGRTFVFSDVLTVEGTPMLAVGAPILGDGSQAGLVIGYILLRTSGLQASMTRLGRSSVHGVVDGSGMLVAVSDRALLGTPVPPEVRAAVTNRGPTPTFVEYVDRGREVVAVVSGGVSGGWAYYRAQPAKDFYGPVRNRPCSPTSPCSD